MGTRAHGCARALQAAGQSEGNARRQLRLELLDGCAVAVAQALASTRLHFLRPVSMRRENCAKRHVPPASHAYSWPSSVPQTGCCAC